MYGVFLASTAAATLFNYFPGLSNEASRISAIIDRGLVAELVVKCDEGEGIVAASLAEQTFCAPNFTCYEDLGEAISATCR
jgi:hypothetical protein